MEQMYLIRVIAVYEQPRPVERCFPDFYVTCGSLGDCQLDSCASKRELGLQATTGRTFVETDRVVEGVGLCSTGRSNDSSVEPCNVLLIGTPECGRVARMG